MNKIISVSTRKCFEVKNSTYPFVSGFREEETLVLTFRLYWVVL